MFTCRLVVLELGLRKHYGRDELIIANYIPSLFMMFQVLPCGRASFIFSARPGRFMRNDAQLMKTRAWDWEHSGRFLLVLMMLLIVSNKSRKNSRLSWFSEKKQKINVTFFRFSASFQISLKGFLKLFQFQCGLRRENRTQFLPIIDPLKDFVESSPHHDVFTDLFKEI